MATTVRSSESRALLALAFERCTERKRLVLTLLLVERLSPAEIADALGTSIPRIQRTYREALVELKQTRRATLSTLSQPRSRRSTGERLRKAS